MGLVAPWHVGSSWTRDRTSVPCSARWILNHWTTREAPLPPSWWTSLRIEHLLPMSAEPYWLLRVILSFSLDQCTEILGLEWKLHFSFSFPKEVSILCPFSEFFRAMPAVETMSMPSALWVRLYSNRSLWKWLEGCYIVNSFHSWRNWWLRGFLLLLSYAGLEGLTQVNWNCFYKFQCDCSQFWTHLGYWNYLTGFWSFHKGILGLKVLLN